jgi:YihY family inner membrane protein
MRTLAQGRLARLVRLGAARFKADDLGTQASAWAFIAYLSLFPIMLLALSVAGFVLAGQTEDELRKLFADLPGIGPLLDQYLGGIVVARGSLGAIAVVGLVWSASGLGNRSAAALALIFRISDPGLMRRRARAIASMLALGALILGAILLTGLIPSLDLEGALGWLATLASYALVAAIEFAFFLISYRLLTPTGGPPIRDHVPGAVAMTVCWSALKLVGGLFVTSVIVKASALYGTIGVVFGVLVFLRVAATLYLGSAEVSALIREGRAAGPEPEPARPARSAP